MGSFRIWSYHAIVLFLTTLPTLRADNSLYMQGYFKRFFCFVFLGNCIFISDQNINAKSNRNRNCVFHSLGNPKGRTLDYNGACIHTLTIHLIQKVWIKRKTKVTPIYTIYPTLSLVYIVNPTSTVTKSIYI